MPNPKIPPLPQAFRENMRTQFPDGQALLDAIEFGSPAVGLRINPAKQRALAWPISPVPWAQNGYYLEADEGRPGLHPYHAAGAYYMQEPSAMCAAPLLNVTPSMRVLDLCAAPGGKSGQIADALAGEGLLISNEIDPKRARALASNLERLGHTNALILSERPDHLAERFPGAFDAILVDAPCSGEGMFRRESLSRLSWTPEAPAACARRQLAILQSATAMLRPGGTLVYSTCTFNRTENEDVIGELVRHSDAYIIEEMRRILPQLHRGEGHFAAKLRKKGDAPRASWPSLAKREYRQGDWLFRLPEGCPPLDGLHVIRAGLQTAEIKKDRQEPAHALSMAIGVNTDAPAFELTEEEALRYLRGESIPAPHAPQGFLLCRYDGLTLGWGKASEGQIKNRLPKGLRRQK